MTSLPLSPTIQPEMLIAALLLLPLLAATTTLLSGRWANLRDGLSVLIGLATALCAITVFRDVQAGASPQLTVLTFAPGFTIDFVVEPLGALFALVAGCLWPVATLYSVGYMRGAHEKNHTRFFFFYAVAIHAAMGIALSGNLLTLFIFYEMLTFSTYPLVAHKGNAESVSSARIYLGILVTSSVAFLLVGMIAVWVIAGDLTFTAGGVLSDHLDPSFAPLLLALFAFGIGKAALMPLHRWLPAAMVAPTPVSALLHAVAVVKAGVFTVLKVVIYIFGTDYLLTTGTSEWLVYVASFTLLAASIVAVQKTNLKARLAYSTISQLAYVVLGAALASSIAVQGAALHIIMHAAGKITLFFCAGAIYVAHHHSDLRDMDGLGRRMPITFFCFALGALSIMGIPPLGGAWSKFMLMMGALEAGQMIIVFVLIISSLLNLYYLGQPIIRGFFAPSPEPDQTLAEAPIAMLIPIMLSALASVLLFFYADLFLLTFEGVAP